MERPHLFTKGDNNKIAKFKKLLLLNYWAKYIIYLIITLLKCIHWFELVSHVSDFLKICIQARKNLEVIRVKNTELFQNSYQKCKKFCVFFKTNKHINKTYYGFNVEKNLIITYYNKSFKSSFTTEINQIFQLLNFRDTLTYVFMNCLFLLYSKYWHGMTTTFS